MTCVIVGTVKEIDINGAILEDHQTGDLHKVRLIDPLETKVNDYALFVGEKKGEILTVTRKEIEKFLDPLYEEDLLYKSGSTNFIPLIEDPFPEVFERLKTLQ